MLQAALPLYQRTPHSQGAATRTPILTQGRGLLKQLAPSVRPQQQLQGLVPLGHAQRLLHRPWLNPPTLRRQVLPLVCQRGTLA